MKEKEHAANPDWDRLEHIMKQEDFRSIQAFADHLGLKRAENLYQIKRGNNGISKEFAKVVCEAFPAYPFSWILTGNGVEDFHIAERNPLNIYPCDAINFRHMFGILFQPEDYFTYIPPGVLPPPNNMGCPALLRPLDLANIIYEEFYCIVSAGKCFYRWVYPSERTDEIRVSRTPDGITLPMKMAVIDEVYLVRGILIEPFRT